MKKVVNALNKFASYQASMWNYKFFNLKMYDPSNDKDNIAKMFNQFCEFFEFFEDSKKKKGSIIVSQRMGNPKIQFLSPNREWLLSFEYDGSGILNVCQAFNEIAVHHAPDFEKEIFAFIKREIQDQ